VFTPAVEKPGHEWKLPALAARVIVGGLFLVSAVGKIIAPEEFAEEIRAYEMLPVIVTNALAYILPWVELFAGLLLVIGVWRKEARLIIAVMLVVFTVAKAYTYAQGKQIDCGCGGSIAFLKYIYNSPQGILTNVVLLALLGVDWRAARLSRGAGKALAGGPGVEARQSP
jgi:uncharacterized membrane protein YphA (DoxX/SURF4 family)